MNTRTETVRIAEEEEELLSMYLRRWSPEYKYKTVHVFSKDVLTL